MPNALTRCLLTGLLVLGIPALAACGSSKKKTASKPSAPSAAAGTIPISIGESGTTARFTVPASAPGGAVTLSFTNHGKTIHGAQLIRFDPPHTGQQAIQTLGTIISGQVKTTPSWLHAEGGIGAAPPGGAATAGLDLPAGSYLVIDVAGGGQSGPPAFAPLTITTGTAGSLPATGTTITAANPSKDHYKWQISGPLHSGANNLTFVSKGSEAIHQITAFRITSKVSKATIIKDLNSTSSAPPSYVDPSTLYSTAAIDGNKSQTTPLELAKPGTYVLFCHFRDRTGGKYHYQEGLLTTVVVK